MIKNLFRTDPETQAVLEDLQGTPEKCLEFHLSGSRFFGTSHEGSDWDFFTADSMEVRRYLKNSGFVTCENESYQDPLCCAVFKKGLVHVQIVSDLEAKLRIQNLLFGSRFYTLKPTKEQARAVWHAMAQMTFWALTRKGGIII